MHVNESEYYISDMKKNISQIVKQKTLERLNRNDIPPGSDVKPQKVFKVTWAFKLELLSNRIPLKYKSCYCFHEYI